MLETDPRVTYKYDYASSWNSLSVFPFPWQHIIEHHLLSSLIFNS